MKYCIPILLILMFGCNKNNNSKINEFVKSADTLAVEKNISDFTLKSEIIPKEIEEPDSISLNVPTNATILWKNYKTAKENLKIAKESDDIFQIKKYLLEAAFYSEKLQRNDIASWQYNNIGYYSIEEFKKRTGYVERIYLYSLKKNPEEQKKYAKETQQILKLEMKLIDDAEKYLLIAQKIDSGLNDDSRTETIISNLQFVKYVRDFMAYKTD